MEADWKKYLGLYALPLYFILNFSLLTPPLTWINLIATTTVFFWWEKKLLPPSITILAILLLYAGIHLKNGIEISYFLKSSAFLVSMPITAFAAYYFLKKKQKSLNRGFELSAYFIAALFIIALILYPTNYFEFLWSAHDFIGEGDTFMRYKGLAYEPSHLALVASPVFIYFLIKFALYRSPKDLIYLTFSGVPILATFSFGFAASFLFAISIISIIIPFMGGSLGKAMLVLLVFLAFLGAGIMLTDNVLSKRINIVLEGKDTSVNGRTTEAFYLANECAKEKSHLFGIGSGQIKVIGEEIIRPFYYERDSYGYSKENWPIMALPNASAETLAMFGILGLILRFGLQIFLFFKTKVYLNWFQLFLFLFIFTYQLMGSFFLSTAELIIWVLAFSNLFPNFNIKKFTNEFN